MNSGVHNRVIIPIMYELWIFIKIFKTCSAKVVYKVVQNQNIVNIHYRTSLFVKNNISKVVEPNQTKISPDNPHKKPG